MARTGDSLMCHMLTAEASLKSPSDWSTCLDDGRWCSVDVDGTTPTQGACLLIARADLRALLARGPPTSSPPRPPQKRCLEQALQSLLARGPPAEAPPPPPSAPMGGDNVSGGTALQD